MLLLLLALIFSFSIYYLGSKKAISSIPLAMWFSVITLTTVGLGDVVPDDWVSRCLGCGMAVLGVIMLTMTTPIFVSNFHSLYINAIVGQPGTIQNLHKKLGKDIHPSSSTTYTGSEYSLQEGLPSSLSSLASTATSKVKKSSRFCRWCKGACLSQESCCKNRIFPFQQQPYMYESQYESLKVPRKQSSKSHKEASANMEKNWLEVHRQSVRSRKEEGRRLSLEADSDANYESDSSAGATTTSTGALGDTESEGDELGDVAPITNPFHLKVFRKHRSILHPRYRTWYDNYNTTSGDETTGSARSVSFQQVVQASSQRRLQRQMSGSGSRARLKYSDGISAFQTNLAKSRRFSAYAPRHAGVSSTAGTRSRFTDERTGQKPFCDFHVRTELAKKAEGDEADRALSRILSLKPHSSPSAGQHKPNSKETEDFSRKAPQR
ncbi:hypothetical protein ACOMHN_035863 [Nucella lapillus]